MTSLSPVVESIPDAGICNRQAYSPPQSPNCSKIVARPASHGLAQRWPSGFRCPATFAGAGQMARKLVAVRCAYPCYTIRRTCLLTRMERDLLCYPARLPRNLFGLTSTFRVSTQYASVTLPPLVRASPAITLQFSKNQFRSPADVFRHCAQR